VPHGAAEHDTDQMTPLFVGSLVTVAVNCAVALASTLAVPGETDTAIAAGTVMVAEAAAEALATEVAVMVTVKLAAGGVVGAVKVVATPLAVALGETVPHVAAEHDTDHITPLFAESFVTVAVNCAVAPACTVAVLGVTETAIPAGTVMVADFDTEVLATEVAVMVTVKLAAGGAVGAV
jgi:hypothetical protein